ncbi:hypothetical protein HMPREF7215_1647, partial [Pyramidobacter piscolens W5455]
MFYGFESTLKIFRQNRETHAKNHNAAFSFCP